MAVLLAVGCSRAVTRKPATRETAAEKRKAMDLFIEGKVAEAKGDYNSAITSYIEAFQYDPGSDEISVAIAKAFLRGRKLRSSLVYAEKAAEINPSKAETWRLLQQLYQLDGRTADAADALKMFMKLDPNSGFSDIVWLSRYYFDLDRHEDARKLLKSSIENGKISAEDMSGAANLLAEEGYADDAIFIYTSIVGRDPLDVDAWITLGELYEYSRRWDDARTAYETGLEKNPGNLDLLVTVGNLCLFENDWECAIAYFEQAAAGNADIPKIRKTLTALYLYSGRDSEALASLESLKSAGEDDAQLYFSIGKAMNYLGRFEESVGYYRTGFERGVDGMTSDDLFRAYGGLASAFVQLGRHDEAIELVRIGASGKIDNPEALKLLEASIYTEMNRFEDAISIYEWLLGSDPKNIRYLLMLGQTYNRAKDYTNAERTFLRIKDVDPDNIDYLIQLSIVYDFSGQFKKAEKSLLDALRKQPDNALALNNLAYMYIEHDTNLSKAIDMAKTALSAEPRNGAYHDTLGWGYYKKGDYSSARSHIESALKWEDTPDKGVIYDHYGDILIKLGLKNEAREAYRKAIELGEDQTRIQTKIDAITD